MFKFPPTETPSSIFESIPAQKSSKWDLGGRVGAPCKGLILNGSAIW